MYLTYEEYAALGGTLEEAAFPRAELRARKRIDSFTQGRVARMQTPPDEVKAAMAEIIDVEAGFGAAAQAKAPAVTGFSTDGYSESYGGAAERADSAQAQLDETVRRLLYAVADDAGVPLLYAGVEGR